MLCLPAHVKTALISTMTRLQVRSRQAGHPTSAEAEYARWCDIAQQPLTNGGTDMIAVALNILSPTAFSGFCPWQIMLIKEFIERQLHSLVFTLLLRVSAGGKGNVCVLWQSDEQD